MAGGGATCESSAAGSEDDEKPEAVADCTNEGGCGQDVDGGAQPVALARPTSTVRIFATARGFTLRIMRTDPT